MNFKKVAFPLFSLFLVYQVWSMMASLIERPLQDLGFWEVLLISFYLTLCVTGVFAFPGFVFPTHRVLPESYYTIKNKNALTRTYTLLKVHIFRRLLMLFYWGKNSNRKRYFDGSRSGLKNLSFQSKQSEFGHLAPFVLIILLSLILLLKGYHQLFIWMNVINVIGNFYPIVLQRTHRMRIQALSR